MSTSVSVVLGRDPVNGAEMTDEEILAVALSNVLALCEPLVREANGLDPEDVAMWHWAKRVDAAHVDGKMDEIRTEIAKDEDR